MPAKIEKGTGTHRVKPVRSYATLTNAVAVEANTTYFVVSQEVNGGDHWYDDNTGVATTNGATVTAAVYATNNSTAYSLGTGTTTNSTVPVNLKCATGAWNLARETRYLYAGMTVVQERDQDNVPTVTYTPGLDLSGTFQGTGGIGGLLARTAYDTATPSHAYYHADGNGNITALINAQQAIVAKYLYDPYGNTLAKFGPLADANTARFSSKSWHNASGLYFYGYRFYDPNLQRWLNRDPFFNELNTSFPANGTLQRNAVMASEVSQLYGFCFNNPVNTFDTDGLIAAKGFNRPSAIGCGLKIKNEVWYKYGVTRPLDKDPSARLAHCIAHCRITRECPGHGTTSYWGGLGKEIEDQIKKWGGGGGDGYDSGDMAANAVGRTCARNKSKSCEDQCQAALDSGNLY